MLGRYGVPMIFYYSYAKLVVWLFLFGFLTRMCGSSLEV